MHSQLAQAIENALFQVLMPLFKQTINIFFKICDLFENYGFTL